MSDADPAADPAAQPSPPRTSVRGPQAEPTVREALLSRSQAADHARTAGADSDQRDQAVRGLMRAQLRLALILGVGFFCAVVLISLLLVTTGFGALTLWGVPLAWAVPGLGFFPVLLVLAGYFRRHSEANEQRWAEVLGLSLQSSDSTATPTARPGSGAPR
ncbi:hypothetical protein [Nesterenkonia aurantiaca]|uniref:Uncharacterized protein n=1 Tax=Nesterenkonia aurantiaca TaxID=1436010 RepID=A0A4R7FZ90_9MICC|nr:hypothetical protein [Nesterenkonia aurantiaca]TDS84209.1 hypothetical protein EV640_10867 [Nesterenkonia aurantiaca]